MTPSSLIFFVIITVWAVYVIQHWIRRRDHVATARSVDRFSEAMRVLERRRAAPQMSVTAPPRQSYAVSLSRPAHPDVVVKRAQPRLALVEEVTTPVTAPTPAAASTAPSPTGPTGTRPAARRDVAAGRDVADRPKRRQPAAGAKARRTERASAPLVSPALVRALALLVGIGCLVAGLVLALTTWWAAPAGVAAFGIALAYVRFSVARARRRSVSPVRHPAQRPQMTARRSKTAGRKAVGTKTAGRKAGGPKTAAPGRRTAPLTAAPVAAARVRGSAPIYVAPAAELAPVAKTSPSETSPVEASPAAAGLYDVEAVEAASASTADSQPARQESAEPAEPGTWQPVPVPPPTYTLKARAPRARERAAADTPVEDLPFDGNALALDEEFEELPAVHRVG